MPHLHGGMTLALQQEDAEVQPTSTVERRRSVLSLSPSTLLLSGGEYTRPATSHTSMSPAILATEVEIYIPRSHYPNPTRDMEVWVSDGKFRVEPADMRLHWRCGCYDEEGKWKGGQSGGDVEHTIVVRRRRDGQEPIGEFGRRRRREVEVELEEGATQASRGGEGDKCPGCEVM
ncbi:hypothetical protein BC829DRAFT_380919 [Chytridium lagenaria]|nr:hypothetical protein BC829DRAFT_380919 [Chytridium lagenaria]